MTISNQEISDGFSDYLRIELAYSEHTIKNYEHGISRLIAFCDEENQLVLDLTLEDLKIFLSDFYDLNYARNSISSIISIIKSFYHYLNVKGLKKTDPSQFLYYPKKEKTLPNFLYYSQIKELLEQVDQSDLAGKRNYCLLIVLYSTGVRVSELVNIKLNDINSSELEIKVLGKGKKERIVPINPIALESIATYVDAREKQKIHNEYLFLNQKGGQLSVRGVRYIIDKEVKKTSILNKVSPHTFRHSFASQLLESGMDIRLVQELLGHESLSSTQIYTHVNRSDLQKALNGATIRNSGGKDEKN